MLAKNDTRFFRGGRVFENVCIEIAGAYTRSFTHDEAGGAM